MLIKKKKKSEERRLVRFSPCTFSWQKHWHKHSCLAIMVTHVCGDVWIGAGNCCRHNCFAFSQCPALLLLAGLPCSRFGPCVWFTIQSSAEWEQSWGWEEEVWGRTAAKCIILLNGIYGSVCGEVVISQHDWCWTTSDCAVVKWHFSFLRFLWQLTWFYSKRTKSHPLMWEQMHLLCLKEGKNKAS